MNLKTYLKDLRKKGLGREGIVRHLRNKGVDGKKADLVTDAYIEDFESFSELLGDMNIKDVSREELDEIRDMLRKDIYKKSDETVKPPKNEIQKAAKVTPPKKTGQKPEIEAVKEAKALKRELSEHLALKKVIENLKKDIHKIKDSQTDIKDIEKRMSLIEAGTIKNQEDIEEIRNSIREITETIREIRGML